ncbi:Retrovirus-related Pol polyprotein from transposon TNT 1-94 [Araneus ventricosus]|uniref:Retrovirus-related Pol polyprotein from transposon TNT 1-94 n=1 Tax=Araneus ventricosus TaxID=182803 RepID=A0A4Y2FEE4_ARAVE|nr:Retrovirus-related Pol polyprotein from transposon TNT 1-94 [Araneus ventricosus]
MANSDTCPIEGKGSVKLSYPNGQCFFLNNVIYSSQIRHNLISAPKLDQGGAKFIGQRRKFKFFTEKKGYSQRPCVAVFIKRIRSHLELQSRKVTCFLIKTKNEASDAFRKYQARAERFTGKKIICIRSDNGGEFRGLRFQKDLENMGIKVEFTNSHTPEENGVAKRYNYTACDGIKALLNSSGLSENFWGEALLTFTYCWNRSVHRDFKKTPFEL